MPDAKILSKVNDILQTAKKEQINPSLYLDKFTGYLEQSQAKSELKKITECKGTYNVSQFRKVLLNDLPCFNCLTFKNSSPLALHLSRSIALENAGICMHPTYGFVYIPGSGIKGMARAYAKQIWLPVQKNEEEAKEVINNIFGSQDDKKPCAGKVVFHDAYPKKRPELFVSISNCHHPKYYKGELKLQPGDTGDFEDPKPVYFLAAKPGAKFEFSLSLRQDIKEPDKYKNFVNTAFEFLTGALCHMGAGAKTAAGFGSFSPIGKDIETTLPKNQTRYQILNLTLKLTTPAFLAGAFQEQDDCKLTASALRGQLRWWWRVIHSWALDTSQLLKLETAIWGSIEHASPARIELSDTNNSIRLPDRISMELRYLAYGTYPMRNENTSRPLRYYQEAIAEYNSAIYCSGSFLDNTTDEGKEISKEDVAMQVKFALYLLTKYGGVGAKARKGFGSIVVKDSGFFKIDNKNIDDSLIKQESAKFRKKLFENKITSSEKKDWPLKSQNVIFTADEPLSALRKLSSAYMGFAGKYKNNEKKIALGLPRQIYGPNSKGSKRESSPIHFHLEPKDGNNWLLRMAVIPSRFLPDYASCENFLSEFMKYIEENINRSCRSNNTRR